MEQKCVIFCAAEFDGLVQPVEQQDLVIAADGGLRHTQALGIQPQVILGDFDSLGYVPRGARVHPVEKDDTDSMLAIRLGLERGCRLFYLYGAMDGPRLDHTLANLQALRFLARRGCRGYLVGRDQIATAFTGTLELPSDARGNLSLFSFGEDVTVTIRGLQYTLEGGLLGSDFPLGVSNHFVGEKACIEAKNGILTAVWDRNNGTMEKGGSV
jgi:thiamine pyrophosphokinase